MKNAFGLALVALLLGCGSDPSTETTGGVDGSSTEDSVAATDTGSDAASGTDTVASTDTGVSDVDPTRKRVFVTDAEYDGNLSAVAGGATGFAAADTLCTAAAAKGSLGGTWKGWIWTTAATSPTDRLTDVGPWYLVDRTTLVFANKAAMLAAPSHAIDRSESGQRILDSVWTGRRSSGVAPTCQDWTSNASSVSGGAGAAAFAEIWSNSADTVACNLRLHLYCFEQ